MGRVTVESHLHRPRGRGMSEDDECVHGMDRAWCALCRQPPGAKKAAAAPRKAAARRPLTAEDYGLPPGTPFIDSFRGEHGFLSNFARTPIEFEGVVYPTVEHAFQAAKTTVLSEREKLLANASPTVAKRIGRKVTLRPGWDRIRLEVMRGLVEQKFNDPDLAAMLEATGDARLYEGNWWGDRYWGTVGGEGENHLGELLMEIRARNRRRSVDIGAFRARSSSSSSCSGALAMWRACSMDTSPAATASAVAGASSKASITSRAAFAAPTDSPLCRAIQDAASGAPSRPKAPSPVARRAADVFTNRTRRSALASSGTSDAQSAVDSSDTSKARRARTKASIASDNPAPTRPPPLRTTTEPT